MLVVLIILECNQVYCLKDNPHYLILVGKYVLNKDLILIRDHSNILNKVVFTVLIVHFKFQKNLLNK